MNKEVNITLTTDDIAEALFDLDNKEVAEVISKWKALFDQEYERRKAEGKPIWIFDLNHFMLYVMKEVHIKDYRLCYSFRFYKTRNQKLLKKLSWKTAMRMGFAQFKTFKFIER